MPSLENVQVGWDALDRNGDKIGTVDQVGTRYFIVTRALIFTKDVYVPFSAVDSVDPDSGSVRLNVNKDQIDTMGWDDVSSATAYPSGPR